MTGRDDEPATRHLDVILDTNALRSRNELEFASLDARELRAHHSAELSVVVHVPSIVVAERSFQLKAAYRQSLGATNHIEGLLGKSVTTNGEVDAAVDQLVAEEMKRCEFHELVLDYARVDWARVVRDAVSRRPPFSPDKSEKGFRDRIVMETVRQFDETRAGFQSHATLFVSRDERLRGAIFGGRVGVFAEVGEVAGWINERREGLKTTEAQALRERAAELFYGNDDSLFTFDALLELLITRHQAVFAELPPGFYERFVQEVTVSLPVFLDAALGTRRWRSRVEILSHAIGVSPTATLHWPLVARGSSTGPDASAQSVSKTIRDVFDVYWFTYRGVAGTETEEFGGKRFDSRFPNATQYIRTDIEG